MEEFKIYLSGKFITSNTEIEVINPYTNKAFARTWLCDESIIEQAIQDAENVKSELAKMPVYKRYNILMLIASELEAQKKEAALLISRESGKPLIFARGEIDRAIQTFIVAAEETKRLPGEYISIDWTPAGEGKEAYVKYFPIGIVAGIAPFNFPINLAAHKIAPAIAAGCPIIIKPASSTPLSVLNLAKIIDKTDLPKGAISILPANRTIGDKLVSDQRIKLLTFTGSPEVGWEMKNRAGKKKVILELGGNAGLIVTETADIEKAIQKSVIAGFAYSGQVCIHTQRIIVHKSIFEKFTKLFCKNTNLLKTGNPENENTQISVMIDEKNAKRVEEWVNEAANSGAKVLCGGKRTGSMYEPTVLTNTNNLMKVCAFEIFGPVVTIEVYENFNEAIDYINNSRFGLQAGVFTNKISEMNFAFEHLELGGVIINDTPTFRVDHMPYGGIKDSGLGREGVKYAIKDMMEEKILVKPKL
ncbi:MAG TPA: aldehyde dehydrogenase family protein [Bacteroidales bacterium]|nr:aldehyde dehydrogenase family protein [Bacteroidales bacterium]